MITIMKMGKWLKKKVSHDDNDNETRTLIEGNFHSLVPWTDPNWSMKCTHPDFVNSLWHTAALVHHRLTWLPWMHNILVIMLYVIPTLMKDTNELLILLNSCRHNKNQSSTKMKKKKKLKHQLETLWKGKEKKVRNIIWIEFRATKFYAKFLFRLQNKTKWDADHNYESLVT